MNKTIKDKKQKCMGAILNNIFKINKTRHMVVYLLSGSTAQEALLSKQTAVQLRDHKR